MELQEIYNKIQTYALNTQTVESFKIGDVYLILNSLHINYPIFVANLNYINYEENLIKLNFSFYMVYKLANDSSNIYTAQNNAFKVINNVLKHLENDFGLFPNEQIQINPFSQKFADICAGAYADVTIYFANDERCETFDKPEPGPEDEED